MVRRRGEGRGERSVLRCTSFLNINGYPPFELNNSIYLLVMVMMQAPCGTRGIKRSPGSGAPSTP